MLNFTIPLTKMSDSSTEMVIVVYNVLVSYYPHFIAKHKQNPDSQNTRVASELDLRNLTSNVIRSQSNIHCLFNIFSVYIDNMIWGNM